jgi:hypothetical protein
MKNNFFIFITFLILTLTLNSCSVTSHTNRNISIDKNDLITNNIVVDVKVEPTKTVTATSSVRESIELAKNEAYYKAITEKNIDIVVDPIFEISTIGTRYTAKVTGFAGYYTNPRSKTDAVKELKAVKAENINAFDKMYNLEPIAPVVVKKSVVQTETKSKVILPFGLQSFKPVQNNTGSGKKFDFLVFSSQNQFSFDYGFGSDEFENNGYALGLAFDFNPAKRISVKSELMYGINKEYDHLTKSLYLRCTLFKNFNLIAGPSMLYFTNNDNLQKFNFGYTAGAAYNIGNKIAIEVKSSRYSNVFNESSQSSYLSLNLGLGYKF